MPFYTAITSVKPDTNRSELMLERCGSSHDDSDCPRTGLSNAAAFNSLAPVGPLRSCGAERALRLAGGAVVLGVIAIVGAPLLLLHRQDLPFEQQYGHVMVGLAARLQAGNASNPVANDPRAIAVGREAYTGSCAECHGIVVATGKASLVQGRIRRRRTSPLTTCWKKVTPSCSGSPRMDSASRRWLASAISTPTRRSGTSLPTYALSRMGNPPHSTCRTRRLPSCQLPTPLETLFSAARLCISRRATRQCHGSVGEAPGNLALRGGGETGAIRRGRPGMPAYGPDRISDAQLTDLQAYMRTFAGSRGREPGGEHERGSGDGG